MPTTSLGHHSWDAFCGKAAKRRSNSVRGASDASLTGEGNAGTGVRTFEEGVKLVRDGWQEGAAQIARALDTLPPSADVLPDWDLDVCGAIVNVPAFLSGEPECIWRLQENRRAERRLTLIVPHSYPSMIEPTEAMQYAKGVAAVVRSIEASGINVAVVSACGSTQSDADARTVYSVSVREFGEPLDLARVAVAFHPAFLRRIGFAWREQTEGCTGPGMNNGNYGRARLITLEEARQLLGDSLGNAAILPMLRDVQADLRDDCLPDLIARFRKEVESAISAM